MHAWLEELIQSKTYSSCLLLLIIHHTQRFTFYALKFPNSGSIMPDTWKLWLAKWTQARPEGYKYTLNTERK